MCPSPYSMLARTASDLDHSTSHSPSTTPIEAMTQAAKTAPTSAATHNGNLLLLLSNQPKQPPLRRRHLALGISTAWILSIRQSLRREREWLCTMMVLSLLGRMITLLWRTLGYQVGTLLRDVGLEGRRSCSRTEMLEPYLSGARSRRIVLCMVQMLQRTRRWHRPSNARNRRELRWRMSSQQTTKNGNIRRRGIFSRRSEY